MPNYTINGASKSRFGNVPYGNEAVYRFPVETIATGGLASIAGVRTPLAVNDVVSIGRLQAGMVPDTVKVIVSTAFGAGVTASFGFAYADGVDSTEVPQSPTYFGTGIVLSAVGEIQVPLKTRLLKLPKDVTMTMTITGAAVAKVAFADVIVKGELLGD